MSAMMRCDLPRQQVQQHVSWREVAREVRCQDGLFTAMATSARTTSEWRWRKGFHQWPNEFYVNLKASDGSRSPGDVTSTEAMPQCFPRYMPNELLDLSQDKEALAQKRAMWHPALLCVKKMITRSNVDWEDSVAFAAEQIEEQKAQSGTLTFDGVHGEEDLGSALPEGKASQEADLERHEEQDAQEREADPDYEKRRKREWSKLSKDERISIRRLHCMTSHATRPQMQRMLCYAGSKPHIIKGVKHFRCAVCEKMMTERRVWVAKSPGDYVFGDNVDIFEVPDCNADKHNIIHVTCLGTTYQSGEVVGNASGPPPSPRCLEAVTRSWLSWAGAPKALMADRGLHNWGKFMRELERRGYQSKLAVTEGPHQLGGVERQGGMLKEVLQRIIEAENVVGELDVSLSP
eukprot:s856_g12.t1